MWGGGISGVATFILNCRTIASEGSVAQRPLCALVRARWYPLNRRSHGPKGRSGRFGEEKKRVPLMGIDTRFFGHPVTSQYTDYTV